MTPSAKGNWVIPTGLIALSFVPIAAGTFRMIQLGVGAEVTGDNMRFFAAPVPVLLHISTAIVYCVLGAFQFAPNFRRHKPTWHRIAGRVLVPCGLAVALSGLWMAQFYPPGGEPPASFDGPIVYVLRIAAGAGMAITLCLGLGAIRRRDFAAHRCWMMRGYALGLGAGTQVFTHLPWYLLPSIRGELARTIFMGAGWAVNLAVVEWLICRQRRKHRGLPIPLFTAPLR